MSTPTLTQSSGAQYTRILSFGAARGDLVVPNEDLIGPINSSDEWIRQRTGVVTRKRASKGINAVDLAETAANEALEKAGVPREKIGAVLVSTISNVAVTPSMASLVSLYSPAERQGEIQGVFRSLGALSRAVGPIVACAMYFKFGPEMMYTAGAALIILPLLIARSLPEVRKMAEGQETGVENDE